MSLRTWLARALAPRMLEQHRAVEALGASSKALRRDLAAAQASIADLGSQLAQVDVRLERLATLHAEDVTAAARLDRLEEILDAARVAAHVRDAVGRCVIVEEPVPHAVIGRLLPDEVYAAAVEAVPPPIFFDQASSGGREIRLPLRLAPTHALVTWAFLADMVNRALGPALVERFRAALDRHVSEVWPAPAAADGLRLTAEPGRLVLREPGAAVPIEPLRPWRFLTVVADLAGSTDDERYGSRLGRSLLVPYRANTALVVLGPASAHEYEPVPAAEPPGTARITYECWVGPARDSRPALLTRLDDATRAAWTGAP